MIQEAIIRYLRKHRQESLSPKAVLFDMDGVLYDSMRFHARAWHEVATLHQLISRPEVLGKARSTSYTNALSNETLPPRRSKRSIKRKRIYSIPIMTVPP